MIVESSDGLEADLLFNARTVAVEAARQTMSIDNVAFADMTRMTQAGSWSGWLSVDGTRIEIDSSITWGNRALDPTAAHNIHVQNFCRVTLDGKVGWGVLEQLAIGPHVSGLTGILTPYIS